MKIFKNIFEKRRARNRVALRRKSSKQPRLSVHKTSKNIYVQIIDDKLSKTLAHASTLEKDFKSNNKSGANISAAIIIGKKIANIAKDKKINNVVFDRGGYIYHGRVKALAEAAREEGLKF